MCTLTLAILRVATEFSVWIQIIYWVGWPETTEDDEQRLTREDMDLSQWPYM